MAFGIVAIASSKPAFFLRAEQSGALDLSSHRATGNDYSRLRSKRDFVFIVNPKGANGRTGREWKKLLPLIRKRLGEQCNIHESITSGPSDAQEITREAIKEGAAAVIAVGGDGTLHEVVNGFFLGGNLVAALERELEQSTTLGLIPLGTGSDFARTFGWKNDPYQAIERIAKGSKSKIDIGVITGDSGKRQYFINDADIHLSAKAGYFSSKFKGFGNLCYVIGALRAFIGHKNRDLVIKFDGGDWESFDKVTALCVGNAKFFGGGMKITPNADPSNGNFEVVILQNFRWFDFALKMHKLYDGTHLSEEGIFSRSVESIEVAEVTYRGDVFVQSDGEHFGFLPARISILPAAIEFFN